MKSESLSILVTGANRGLGLGFVEHYLKQGCLVVACCRDLNNAFGLQKLKDNHSDNLLIESLDVSSDDSIEVLTLKFKKQDLKFDIVINNAGICIEENLGGWTKSGFQKNYSVNTIGVALFTQSLLSQIKRGGKLINMSSGMGSIELNINPEAELDAYAMSKAALNMFSVRLAKKLLPRDIIVVAISPGWVQTDMGGQEAPNTVENAISKMGITIKELDIKDSGSFISEIGEILPW